MPTPRLLLTEEFAEIVRLDVTKVRKRIRQGVIEAHNVGSPARPNYRIPETEVERFLNLNKDAPA